MKKALFFIALVAVLASCKKEKTAPAYSIVGKWELRHSTGGGLPATPAGNGNVYEFKADSTFARYVNNAVSATGQYHVQISDRTSASTYGRIVLTSDSYSDSFKLTSDTLILGVASPTGISHVYVKLN